MTVQILIKGKPPEPKRRRINCSNCKSVFLAALSDCTAKGNPIGHELHYHIDCPVCEAPCSITA